MAPPAKLTGPRTSTALYARMDAIALASGGLCQVFEDSGFTSHARGQRLRYMRLASKGSGARQAVLLTGGLHAREWAPPDALLQLAEYLIDAYNSGSDLVLPLITGSVFKPKPPPAPAPPLPPDTVDLPVRRISSNEVQRVLDQLEIFIAPIVNPDGRDYTMGPAAGPLIAGIPQSRLWRKNDPPPNGTSPAPAPAPARGVNLNANFPVPSHAPSLGTLWKDLQRYYSTAGLAGANAKNDPHHNDLYVGPTAASAKETKFVQWLVEQKQVRFFMDVHSSSHLLAYPWAMETNGTDPAKTFLQPGLDTTRDGTTGTAYAEYMPDTAPHQLLRRHQLVSRSIRDSILTAAGAHPNAVARSSYNDDQSNKDGSIAELLYAAPASGMDWVFSRQFTNPALAPIFGFAFEVGDAEEGGFLPNYTNQFQKIEREVVIGVMELLKFAAAWRPPSASRCYVMSASYGSSFHPAIEFVVQLREGELRKTRAGRKFLARVEWIYERVGPPAARYLERHPWLRGVVRRALVEPIVRAIRVCADRTRKLEPREYRARVLVTLLSAWLIGAALSVVLTFFLVLYLVLLA